MTPARSAVPILLLAAAFAAPAAADDRPDVVVADFEADTYGDWTTTGTAFGDGPAAGTLPGQMRVGGFAGDRLANSFHGGDGPTGTLTSPPFEVTRGHLNLLVGGGGYAGETCVNLLVGGEVVRTAVGPNTAPGGSEDLAPRTWDVTEFAGKTAVIRAVDARSGGWGHVNVDQIVLSDEPADVPAPPAAVSRDLTVDGSHLLVPVSNDAPDARDRLELRRGGDLVQSFDVALPRDGDAPDWTAAYPLAHFGLPAGGTVTLTSRDPLPADRAAAFGVVAIGAEADVPRPHRWDRPYRNRFHLAPRRGWNNDPNGLVHHDGRWHVYYQLNPFGIFWGNMHWGHYSSPDLVTWTEHPIALYPNTPDDAMFSGGGFVDHNDTAGFGAGTLFVAFTSTGRGECLAYSEDGGVTFTELPENPVVEHEGRDPKIFWHGPTNRWVMAVYEEEPTAVIAATPASPEANGQIFKPNAQVAFYVSDDLRSWTRTGAFTHPERRAVYECPELFEAPLVGGEPGEARWVLYGGGNRYFVGDFDGENFTAESGPHGGDHGAVYASQNFSNDPAGRNVRVSWLQPPAYVGRFPGQVTNQCLSLPHELVLHATPDGPRLRYVPVEELEALRVETLLDAADLSPAEAAAKLAAFADEPTEVEIAFAGGGRHDVTINGVDAGFTGESARVFNDRTVTEIYADGGRTYRVAARDPGRFDDRSCEIGGDEPVARLTVHRLRSFWPPAGGANATGGGE